MSAKVLASIQFGISAVGLLANIVQLKPDLLTGIRPPLSGISGRLLRVVPIVLLIASVFLQSVILYQLSHTPSKAPPSLTSTPTPSPLSPVQVPFVVYAGHGDVMFNDDWTDNPHQGTTCMQVVYEGPKREGPKKWAGFELLDPSDNWGTISNTGYNLSRASRLSFWVRGNSGGERIAFQMGGGGYDDNGNRVAPYADSVLLQNPSIICICLLK